MFFTRACGYGLESRRANTMPSARKSSAYLASPVTFATTSCGVKSWPSSLCAMVDLRGVAGRAHYGVQVVVVSTTAEQVARHGMPGLLARGLRVLLQQGHGCHDLPRCAETTLRRQFVDEGLLHGMQFAIRAAQALDGDHLAVAHGMRERRT